MISWKTIMKKRDKGYFIEVDVQFTEKFHELFNGLPFLLERMKIKNVKKVVAKNSICYNIGNLKQGLNHGVILKKSS